MSLKKDITEILDNIADILEFKGENPFKINAYRNGANALRNTEEEIETLVKTGDINKIKGVGSSIQSLVSEYVEKGCSLLYNNLLNEVPLGILEFLSIRGLGVKKIKIIIDELGIRSLKELEVACKNNKLASIKGLGEKLQETILKEIGRISATKNQVLLSTADKEVNRLIARFSKLTSIKKIEVSGEFRRNMEIISKIEFVALTINVDAMINEINPKLVSKTKLDKHLTELVLLEIESLLSIPVFLYCTESNEEFTKIFFYSTGTGEFIKKVNVNLENNFSTEEQIFKSVKLNYVIPEMREKEYFELDDRLRVNSNLEFNHLQGLLHFHTTYSDGKNTITEMIQTAKEIGFNYAAVCDHSKAAAYVSGLTEERVLKQKEEIKRISAKQKFKIFHGIESDILKDGELDYPDDFLINFDFIVASVHSRFQMAGNEMTRRIIKAVENPHTDLLGHPTGRLLLSRAPYEVDIKKVIDACSANNVAIEINAYPNRLDLDWRFVYYAREKGCLFSIDPDAHNTDEITLLKYGIAVARKAGVQPEEIINCFDVDKFKKFLNRKVNRKL